MTEESSFRPHWLQLGPGFCHMSGLRFWCVVCGREDFFMSHSDRDGRSNDVIRSILEHSSSCAGPKPPSSPEDIVSELRSIEKTARYQAWLAERDAARIDKDFDDAFTRAQDDIAAIKELVKRRRL